MNKKLLDNYFLVLFSLIPIALLVGSSSSLAIILLIDISFILVLINSQKFYIFKEKSVLLILAIGIYLIFNSIMSQDFSIGFKRNLGFARFLFLFIAFNYFFSNKIFMNKVLLIWTLSLLIVGIDVYIEKFIGSNILGYGGGYYGNRIVSFFKDEPIIGGYINAFYLLIIGYLFYFYNNSSKKYKIMILYFSFFLFLSILITGERSSTIKAFLGLVIFYSINDSFKFKEKITLLIVLFCIIAGIFFNSEYLKKRFTRDFINFHKIFLIPEFDQKHPEGVGNPYTVYFNLYKSGITVFKNYPILGVGNKNYRIITCTVDGGNNYPEEYVCNTHPHQVYIEILSEHGIIGALILLYIFFKLIFTNFKIFLKSKNYIQIGCFAYLVFSFTPLIPSGSFFNDFNLTLFFINMSILYASSKKTNIFKH